MVKYRRLQISRYSLEKWTNQTELEVIQLSWMQSLGQSEPHLQQHKALRHQQLSLLLRHILLKHIRRHFPSVSLSNKSTVTEELSVSVFIQKTNANAQLAKLCITFDLGWQRWSTLNVEGFRLKNEVNVGEWRPGIPTASILIHDPHASSGCCRFPKPLGSQDNISMCTPWLTRNTRKISGIESMLHFRIEGGTAGIERAIRWDRTWWWVASHQPRDSLHIFFYRR